MAQPVACTPSAHPLRTGGVHAPASMSSSALQHAPFTNRDSAAAPAPAVELLEAACAFGAFQALAGVSLAIRAGERVAVLGPSGAGKTTLLRLVNTALHPSSGEVRVLGTRLPAPARPLRALRARIGTVYQGLQLVPQASVLENVLMGRLGRCSALGVAVAALRRREREEVAAVLARVGMAPRMDERVDRLSGGEQQRVAVARVLYQGPDLVVADEPFSSVDPERSRAVLGLLVEVTRGRTLVLSTHQLEPVLPHFPRILGLRGGRLLFDKPREAVTAQDLALLYQPEGATRSPEPRRVLVAREGVDGDASRELRVGASTTPGEHILPRAVAAFARAHPQVALRVAVRATADVIQDLAAGRIDLAFVGARSPHPALHFEDFAEDEIVLVAPPGFGGLPEPLPAPLATRLPRVDREPGSATRAIVEEQLASMGLELDPAARVLEAGSVAALRAAVAAGMGVGFASRRSVAADVASGRLREVQVQAVKVPRRFFAAWRRADALSTAALRFLDLARATVRAERP